MKLFLDMDGVVADFFSEFKKVTGVPHSKIKSQEHFLELARKHIVGTELNLPKFNSVENVLNHIKTTFNDYTILSSPLVGDIENTTKQKSQWIKKNLTSNLPEHEIYSHDKYLYAKGNILVDDYLPNLVKWVEHGGIGVKYKALSEKYDDQDLLRALSEIKELSKEEFKPQLVYLYKHVKYND